MMVNVKQLIEALRDLADAEYQRRAWLASEGPVVSSFDEQACQVFDDTGLSPALDTGRRPPELSEQAFAALKDLGLAVSRVEQGAPPERLLEDPRVAKVRELAARALALLGGRSRGGSPLSGSAGEDDDTEPLRVN